MPRINNKGLVYADRTPERCISLLSGQLGARGFRCCISPSQDWTDRAGAAKGNAPVYLSGQDIHQTFLEVELFLSTVGFHWESRKQRD